MALPHSRSRMTLVRNREAPKHVSATIQAELKRGMGELSGSNHAQLIRDPTAHLNSKVNAKGEFVGFDVLGGTMGVNQFQQASSGLLDGILIAPRPAFKDDMRRHVRLKVSTPQE